MQIERYLSRTIVNDALAKRKMAFVSGPRQVGKSTLAKANLQSPQNYFLFDQDEFRLTWMKSPSKAIAVRGPGPIVLDEIHKDRKWKLRLKGIYDPAPGEIPIIVTGSARLDFFRRGSDSLMGRYFPYRLHPFSVAETPSPPSPDHLFEKLTASFDWASLLHLSGFPEPLLAASEQEGHRWSRLRLDRLVMEDTRDFLNISDLHAFRNLIALLPERVGSLLSVHSLHEEVGKAYGTIRSWMQVLDTLYFCFTVRPYSKKLSRMIRSEPKLYLYDLIQIPKTLMAKRLENLTALHLLKACHYWTDSAQGEFDLHFLRNKDGREVDFVVTRDQVPWMLLECKSGEKQPTKDLVHFTRLLKPKWSLQLVQSPRFDRFYEKDRIRVVDYQTLFSGWV